MYSDLWAPFDPIGHRFARGRYRVFPAITGKGVKLTMAYPNVRKDDHAPSPDKRLGDESTTRQGCVCRAGPSFVRAACSAGGFVEVVHEMAPDPYYFVQFEQSGGRLVCQASATLSLRAACRLRCALQGCPASVGNHVWETMRPGPDIASRAPPRDLVHDLRCSWGGRFFRPRAPPVV
jgi:hypothetical protein